MQQMMSKQSTNSFYMQAKPNTYNLGQIKKINCFTGNRACFLTSARKLFNIFNYIHNGGSLLVQCLLRQLWQTLVALLKPVRCKTRNAEWNGTWNGMERGMEHGMEQNRTWNGNWQEIEWIGIERGMETGKKQNGLEQNVEWKLARNRMEWNRTWNGNWQEICPHGNWQEIAYNQTSNKNQVIIYIFKGLVRILHVGTLSGSDKAEYKYHLECGGSKAQSLVQLPLHTRFGSGNVKLSPCGE